MLADVVAVIGKNLGILEINKLLSILLGKFIKLDVELILGMVFFSKCPLFQSAKYTKWHLLTNIYDLWEALLIIITNVYMG